MALLELDWVTRLSYSRRRVLSWMTSSLATGAWCSYSSCYATTSAR